MSKIWTIVIMICMFLLGILLSSGTKSTATMSTVVYGKDIRVVNSEVKSLSRNGYHAVGITASDGVIYVLMEY